MADINNKVQIHRARIKAALLAAEAANSDADLSDLHTALAQADARLVQYFGLTDTGGVTESGGTDKPPVDPNDDGEGGDGGEG